MSSHITTKTLLRQLTKNREYNAPLVNVAERNCHEDVEIIGNSIRIRDKISKTYLFSVANWDELEVLLEDTGEELDTFMINNGIYKKEVLHKFPRAIICEYDFYVMNKKENLCGSQPIKNFEIVNLDLNWLNFILVRYKDKEFSNERYISDRILYGKGLGLLHEGEKKVAFVLQHKNGETGALVVEQKYRGRGLGGEFLKHFNRVLFENNSILFALVEKNNIAGAKTMVNGGYKKSKQRYHLGVPYEKRYTISSVGQ
ncbi:MAG: GNAT family N-acetyltransferase [Desulfosporosinus sp.]|jgi:GNAT superfamily N-acetyltransferase